jgi:hypothetical protein
MSHNSLVELRSPHFDKQIYSLPLSAKQTGIISHHYAKLLMAELIVTIASRQFLWPRQVHKDAHEALKESIRM